MPDFSLKGYMNFQSYLQYIRVYFHSTFINKEHSPYNCFLSDREHILSYFNILKIITDTDFYVFFPMAVNCCFVNFLFKYWAVFFLQGDSIFIFEVWFLKKYRIRFFTLCHVTVYFLAANFL